MDHQQAVELQLAAKYVLGELPAVQRDEYEDHYVDCPECAKEVHAAAAFADTAREVFRQEAQGGRAQRAQGQLRGGWFAWLRPVVVVPALVVLLLIIAYQNTITIPLAKKAAGSEVAFQNPTGPNPSDKAAMQASLSQGAASSEPAGMKAVLVGVAFPLHALGGRRGEDAGTTGTSRGDQIQVQPGENFALRLDFTPNPVFDSYAGKLADASGHEVFRLTVPGSTTNKTVQLAIPAGLLKPGTYSLTFAGDPGAKGLGNGGEVLRYRFSVAFRQ